MKVTRRWFDDWPAFATADHLVPLFELPIKEVHFPYFWAARASDRGVPDDRLIVLPRGASGGQMLSVINWTEGLKRMIAPVGAR